MNFKHNNFSNFILKATCNHVQLLRAKYIIFLQPSLIFQYSHLFLCQNHLISLCKFPKAVFTSFTFFKTKDMYHVYNLHAFSWESSFLLSLMVLLLYHNILIEKHKVNLWLLRYLTVIIQIKCTNNLVFWTNLNQLSVKFKVIIQGTLKLLC